MLKRCTKCLEEKHKDLFSNRKAAPDGKMPECKVCNYQRNIRFRKDNPERYRAWMITWRANNKDHILAYEKTNRASSTSRLAKYRAKKLLATVYFGDRELNDFVIAEAYYLAKLRTELTGINWQVDHIVPLQSKIVCGLHYYTNLRVITAKENQMKSNKYWKDMP